MSSSRPSTISLSSIHMSVETVQQHTNRTKSLQYIFKSTNATEFDNKSAEHKAKSI